MMIMSALLTVAIVNVSACASAAEPRRAAANATVKRTEGMMAPSLIDLLL